MSQGLVFFLQGTGLHSYLGTFCEEHEGIRQREHKSNQRGDKRKNETSPGGLLEAKWHTELLLHDGSGMNFNMCSLQSMARFSFRSGLQ